MVLNIFSRMKSWDVSRSYVCCKLSVCGFSHARFGFHSLLKCKISFSLSSLAHSCTTSRVYKGNLIQSLQTSGSIWQLTTSEHAGSQPTTWSNYLKQHRDTFYSMANMPKNHSPGKTKIIILWEDSKKLKILKNRNRMSITKLICLPLILTYSLKCLHRSPGDQQWIPDFCVAVSSCPLIHLMLSPLGFCLHAEFRPPTGWCCTRENDLLDQT